MSAIPVFVLLTLVLWSFGDRILRWLGVWIEGAAERFALSTIVAFGAVTLLVFSLAVARAVTVYSCLGLALVMAAVSFRELRTNLGILVRGAREIPWRRIPWPRGGWQGWASWLTGVIVLLGAVQALAPATGMDTGIFHFAAVKIMLREHGLLTAPDDWFHRTGGVYMVYLFGMAIQGEGLARLLSFAASPLALLVAAAASERLRPATGRMAAAAIALTPMFTGFTGYQYLELPVLMYLLAAWLCFDRYRAGGERGWAVLSSAMVGFSLGVKVSAFPVLVFLIPLLLAVVRREGTQAWKSTIAGALAFGAAAGFWPIWNWATTGSFVHGYLHASVMDDHSTTDYSRWFVRLLPALGSLVTTSEYWLDSAGPFLISALAAVLIFRAPEESRLPARLVLGAAVFYFAVLVLRLRTYLWVDAHARYLGPCLLAFGALAAGPLLAWAERGPRWLRTALLAAVLLPAVPLVILKSGKAAVAAPAAFGLESRSHYLSKKVETYPACEILNSLPDPEVRVLFLARRPYYLDRPMAPYGFWIGVRTREDFVRRVRETRITHVLYEPGRPTHPLLKDPDALLSGPPFRELRRWPWKQTGFVRLLAVERP